MSTPATTAPVPFIREAGAGPGVVCLHSNASSSGQWRALMERLALRNPIYKKTTNYGHFGKAGLPWEE